MPTKKDSAAKDSATAAQATDHSGFIEDFEDIEDIENESTQGGTRRY